MDLGPGGEALWAWEKERVAQPAALCNGGEKIKRNQSRGQSAAIDAERRRIANCELLSFCGFGCHRVVHRSRPLRVGQAFVGRGCAHAIGCWASRASRSHFTASERTQTPFDARQLPAARTTPSQDIASASKSLLVLCFALLTHSHSFQRQAIAAKSSIARQARPSGPLDKPTPAAPPAATPIGSATTHPPRPLPVCLPVLRQACRSLSGRSCPWPTPDPRLPTLFTTTYCYTTSSVARRWP